MRFPTNRRVITASTVAAVAAALVTWWALATGSGHHAARPPAPVSDIDTLRRACLATDTASPTQTTAAVWAYMRQAATADRTLLVQHLTRPAQVTPATYLATLSQMRCTTIVTIGDPLSAATTHAPHTATRYLTITNQATTGTGTHLTPAQVNATAITAALRPTRAGG